MLAQTNLQLYRQLTQAAWPSAELVRVRAAYDIARELFVGCYRPTHKPFVCHLVGTASAAASWNAPPAVVIAALLHSAYLYGEWGDGERGASPRRRLYLQQAIGVDAEAIVARYESSKPGEASPASDIEDPVVFGAKLVRLADLLDELGDDGPHYAPSKGIGAQLTAAEFRRRIYSQADELVGPAAVEAFKAAFAACDAARVDAVLVTTDKSYLRVEPGCAALRRTPLGRRAARLTYKLLKDQAA